MNFVDLQNNNISVLESPHWHITIIASWQVYFWYVQWFYTENLHLFPVPCFPRSWIRTKCFDLLLPVSISYFSWYPHPYQQAFPWSTHSLLPIFPVVVILLLVCFPIFSICTFHEVCVKIPWLCVCLGKCKQFSVHCTPRQTYKMKAVVPKGISTSAG